MGDFLMNEESDKINPDDANNDQNGFGLGYGYVRVNAKHDLEKARGKE
jgi:hypothetical protein